MKRRHDMPFGAQYREDGTTRFRLWAPAAKKISVSLAGKTAIDLPIQPSEGGWFELVTDAAPPGSEYQFRIDDQQLVPDPASRFQPHDVHGPSAVVDTQKFEWSDEKWRGRPWHEAIIYEVHVGAFSPLGTFAGVTARLDYLVDLGISALELMPVADFPGQRNWGYDGVLLFAPDSTYGRPEDLKALVQEAHKRNLMVLLDVVYNHFGPEGNYLRTYSPQFFTDRHRTPWGDAINFDGPESQTVRNFFVHNALYWLTEYHLDGLRFDAVHAIVDDSSSHIVMELATRIREQIPPDRQVHLVLENDANQSRYLLRGRDCKPIAHTAQWNDDIHHAAHVLLCGEVDGYYVDYAENPVEHLGRCLVSGFAYQGENSTFRQGASRGEASEGLPLTAFVSFLQNHDQVGNRAFGERIVSIADPQVIRAMLAIFLLAPSVPLLFMGEEFGATTPFLFFCDFEEPLATAVRNGRRSEFEHFGKFKDPRLRDQIPDPTAEETFAASHLDWGHITSRDGKHWLSYYRELISLRQRHIAPNLSNACRVHAEYKVLGDRALSVRWQLSEQSELRLIANLKNSSMVHREAGGSNLTFATHSPESFAGNTLPAWSVMFFLNE
jgi:malto-oligosyltrehalose trehalohydrolase